MKLYDFGPAPNPRRLRVYLAEKGLSVPRVEVSLLAGQQRTPEFLAVNPMGSLPVLELDDGTVLTESGAIIEYFEELHPEPPMLGTTPLERALARRLDRIAEVSVLFRVARYFHATLALLPGATKSPELAAWALADLPKGLSVLDGELAGRPFLAGERVTVGDCTLFACFEMARFAELELERCGGEHRELARWYGAFRERPSAAA